jgi:hypothetical protein
MAVTRLRASEADRDAVLVALREHHAAGRLSTTTFDHRIASLESSSSRHELGALLVDLPPAAPLPPRLRERIATAIDPRRRTPRLRLSPPGYLAPGKRLLIGRSHGCDLTFADQSVSRCHADLRREGETWIIRDVGSTNGIAVNGLMVRQARLAPGDHITLGRVKLQWDPSPYC